MRLKKAGPSSIISDWTQKARRRNGRADAGLCGPGTQLYVYLLAAWDRVLQPEKDELHVLIRTREGTRRLLLCAAANSARAHITQEVKPNPDEPPMFCMLLRKLLGGSRVEDVRQVDGDRILEIVFSCTDELGDRTERVLCCEMMGRHSNLILRGADGRIADAIRHVGADVSRVRGGPARHRIPAPAFSGQARPGAGRRSRAAGLYVYLLSRLDKALADGPERVERRQRPGARLPPDRSALPHDGRRRARRAGGAPARAAGRATLFRPAGAAAQRGRRTLRRFPLPAAPSPPEWQREVPEGPSAALDAFYRLRDRRERMAQKSASLARSLKTHIERCEKRLAIHEETLAASGRIEEARICGELLTAHLHQIKKGEPSVTLEDYYSGKARTIALDTRLTPAQNAQKYYRQYQKLRQAQLHAAGQAEQARRSLRCWKRSWTTCANARDRRSWTKSAPCWRPAAICAPRTARGKAPPCRPVPTMRFVSADGYEILVGRNSAQNDRLTATAPPDALWLHAKDMAGSHVRRAEGRGHPGGDGCARPRCWPPGSAGAIAPRRCPWIIRAAARQKAGRRAGRLRPLHPSAHAVRHARRARGARAVPGRNAVSALLRR